MLRHLTLLLVLALIWSSSYTVIKIAVVTIPPLTLAAGRIVLAAVVLSCFAWLRGHRVPSGRRFWVFCLLLGFFGNGLPFALINWGEQRIDSGLAAILMSVMPLATVVMAHFFTHGDRMTPAKLIGVAVGFGGVVILVGPEALKGLGGDVWRQLAVATAALSYGVAVILTRNMGPTSLTVRAAAVMFAASLVMMPMALIFEIPWTLRPSTGALAIAVYLGLIPTAGATIIFFHLIEKRGASFMAFINYLIPVFGVILGAVVLGERVTAQAMMALAVILIGLAIAKFERSPA